jgi:uncharacterized membrane protein
MVKVLVALTILWPLLLAVSVWQRATAGPTTWTAIVQVIGSRICHQRPERSFHTAGVQWPVCGRCSGLYFAAPFGALAAVSRRRRHDTSRTRALLAVAAIPTALTLLIEWLGIAPVGNAARFLSALPLAAAGASAIVTAVRRPGID